MKGSAPVMNKIPIIVICGATASGKTSLSIDLAKKYDTKIVSCDSMQIYKDMDIGTAKPSVEEMDNIEHFMIDIIDSSVNFSVADFVGIAHDKIKSIYEEKKVPVLVGGTGLYINSLVNDVDFLEEKEDKKIRRELEEIEKQKGIDYLVEMLKEFDPVSAEKIHKNNKRRIIRAIEFYKLMNIPISVHNEETKKKISRYNPCMMAIKWDMQKLYERIEKRVDIMIQKGLLDEVSLLLDKGIKKDTTAMRGIGYKEIIKHLEGEISLDEAIDEIKKNTRHYAKRQMTWFRKDERINWIDYDCDVFSEAVKIINNWGGV